VLLRALRGGEEGGEEGGREEGRREEGGVCISRYVVQVL